MRKERGERKRKRGYPIRRMKREAGMPSDERLGASAGPRERSNEKEHSNTHKRMCVCIMRAPSEPP